MVGRELKCQFELFDRALAVSQPVERDSTVVVGVGEVRAKVADPIEWFDRLAVSTELQQRAAVIVADERVVTEDRLIVAKTLFDLTEIAVAVDEAEASSNKSGLKLERPAQIDLGVLHLAF